MSFLSRRSLGVPRVFGGAVIAVFCVAAVGSGCGESSQGEGGAGPGSTTSVSAGGAAPSSSTAESTATGTTATTASTASAGGGGATSTGAGGAATGVGGGGGMADPNCPPAPTGAVPPLQLTLIASGLDYPTYVGGAPGDPTRLYVVERTGLIRILKNGVLLPTPFLDIVSITDQPTMNIYEARGILGMTFHPDFAQNGRFFVHYMASAGGGHGTIAEYARSADPDIAVPTATQVLVVIDEVQLMNHNGGGIAFGADGMLYASFGDGGGQEDPFENGQNIDSKLGKILRIDPDTYPVPPPGNLPNGNPHVWDYGLRNPWRISFDRCTGDLYIADVGQYLWEEVNVEPAGQGNKNYGWDEMEGMHCFEPASGCDMSGTLPVIEYDHAAGCSITGGYVYRGTKIPNLVGQYLYGDYCTNRIWSFGWEGSLVSGPTEWSDDLQSETLLAGITSFGEDDAGELYVVDLVGNLYRIDPE